MLSDIYNTIGDKFFSGLSSPNKALYINCMESIYLMSEGQISHIHTRERVFQCISSCIAETHAELYENDGTEISDTISKKAGRVLASLIEFGWLISEDIENEFGQNIYLSEPGTMLVRFLQDLSKPTQKEYTTFIFNMYNALTNRQQWEENPYALMLAPVYNNTMGLSDALRDLNTYLKNIIKRMGGHTTYQELFENLSDYAEGMFLKQYERLIRQNVHSYGAVIIRILGEVRQDENLMDRLAYGYALEHDSTDIDNARFCVHDMIDQIILFLSEQYIRIMNDIASKMVKYIDVLLARLKFMESSGSTDMRDVIETFLKAEVAEIQKDKSHIERELSLFNIYRCTQIDPRALKKIGKRREKSVAIQENIETLSEEDEIKSLGEIKKKADNPFSSEKTSKILNNLIHGKNSISFHDFPSETNNDFLTAMAAACFANDIGYIIKDNGGYIKNGNYQLADADICKGENDVHNRRTEAGNGTI